jgi:hypothetical protein
MLELIADFLRNYINACSFFYWKNIISYFTRAYALIHKDIGKKNLRNDLSFKIFMIIL